MFSIKIISLRKDRFKRELILEQLENLELIKFTQIVDAVDGKALSFEILMAESSHQIYFESTKFYKPLTAGEIGCYLSHQAIYQSMGTGDICLVLEDDIIISPKLIELIDQIEKLPSNWDVLLLGHQVHRFRGAFTSIFGRKKLGKFTIGKPTEHCAGSYGYLICYKGAQKLIQAGKTIKNRPIDYFTGNTDIINLYVLVKPIIHFSKVLSESSSLTYDRNLLKNIFKVNHALMPFKNYIKRSFLYHPLRYLLLVIVFIFECFSIFRNVRPYN